MAEDKLMPTYLYSVSGRRYQLTKTTTQFFFEEREYRTVGTYAFDGAAAPLDESCPAAATLAPPRQAWEEGLLRCKEADKKWQAELEARRRGSRG